MKRLPIHLLAAAVGLGGTVGVLALVLLINDFTAAPPKEAPGARQVIEMAQVKRKPPKKRQQKPKPKKAQPRRAARPDAPPPPSLGASLGGLDLGMPGMGGLDMGGGAAQALQGGKKAADLVMTEAAVDKKPRPLRRVPPRYPPRAQAKGITGNVVMEALIGSAGDVSKVRVVDAKPRGVFEDSALAAVQSWQFEPAMYQGQPVRMRMRIKLNFGLN